MNKYAFGFALNDYPGFGSDLAGCVNDGKDLKKKLMKKNFDSKVLIDTEITRKSVFAGIDELLAISKAGDSLFFHNSSHGTYEYRPGSPEADKTDEGFCVLSEDRKSIDIIWDKEIWLRFKNKKPGVQCVWWADSCFGGGAMRLVGSTAKGTPRSIPLAAILKTGAQPAPHPKTTEPSFFEDKSPWPFLWMAGSQEIEPCYDATFGGRANGAFTYWGLKVLDYTPPGLTYYGWYQAICKKLPSQDYPQHPLIAGSYQNAKIFS